MKNQVFWVRWGRKVVWRGGHASFEQCRRPRRDRQVAVGSLVSRHDVVGEVCVDKVRHHLWRRQLWWRWRWRRWRRRCWGRRCRNGWYRCGEGVNKESWKFGKYFQSSTGSNGSPMPLTTGPNYVHDMQNNLIKHNAIASYDYRAGRLENFLKFNFQSCNLGT